MGYEESTVCLETIMQQCHSHISEADIDHMFLHAPEIIHTIRAEGCVADSLLDELGICKLKGEMHINRDDLVTYRQHAKVMSHRASKANFVDYQAMLKERNDPILQQQKKLQGQAAKVIQRAEAAKEKSDLAVLEKAWRVAGKVTEKERRAALSATDRKVEDGSKKLEIATRKAAKTLEAARKLRAAIEIAGGVAAPLLDAAANG